MGFPLPSIDGSARKFLAIVAIALALSEVAAWAGPLEDGIAADQRGDVSDAVKWYRVAAAQGDATAQALLGASFRVTRQHGELVTMASGMPAIATIHPSAVLRSDDQTRRAHGFRASAVLPRYSGSLSRSCSNAPLSSPTTNPPSTRSDSRRLRKGGPR